MKVSLSICAKELTSATSVATGATLTSADNYYATVSRCNSNTTTTNDDDNVLLGTTNIAYQTQNPTWTQAIILDYDEDDDKDKTSIKDDNISITIYKHPTNTKIATHRFRFQDIWNTIPNHAVAAYVTTNNEENEPPQRTKILTSQGRQEKGIIIAVHMEEKVVTGSLKLKLRGKQLDNVDGRLFNLSLDKSDPFYEIKNKQGVTAYTSEVIADDLNPKWKESSNIDLTKLCRNDKDDDFRTAPLQIVVMDEDLHEDDPSVQPTKTELIGVVSTTIEELLVLANNNNKTKPTATIDNISTPILKLTRKGKLSGKLIVESAQLVGLEDASFEALAILERRAQIELAEAKARVAARAKYYAAELQTMSLQRQEKALTAAELLADIQTLANDKQQAAKELKSQLKSQGSCTGTLQLTLRGRNLPDLDGLIPGWGNKSDPFFEVHGYNGNVIYKSEVIRDNLNPEWKTANLDLNALTHGNLDVKVRITVYDQDPNEKREYMGQLLLSVNSMLAYSSSSRSYDLVKGLKDNGGQGQLIVQEAKLVDYVDLKRKADELKKEAQNVLQSSYDMKKLSQSNAEAAQGTIVEQKKAQREALLAEKVAVEAAITVQELIISQQ